MKKKKVILGLSGGVDSAVAAVLLKQQGYDVHSVYIVCWYEPGCRAEADRADAVKVALQLDLPFQVIDFRNVYKDKVMEYFYKEYKEGRTPNPDVLCNSVIKFGLFYDWAIKQGYDYIATGHYARIKDKQLLTPKDMSKDQTYFIYRLRQDQLGHLLFPLGNLLKSEVREIARMQQLPVAEKKDSVGICFVGDVNVSKMLEERFGKQKGEVQLNDGTVVGEHEGHWFFTVGTRGRWQRKKKISSEKFENNELPPLYVVRIDKEKNIVVVGLREEAMKSEFVLTDVHWMNQTENLKLNTKNIFVRVRNTGNLLPATIERLNGNLRVQLHEPEFGIAPGQSGVIYAQHKDGYAVLGGGVIKE